MHMADALITPQVGAVMYAASTGVAAYSINKVKTKEDFQSKVPLMGVVSAFVFAAQMVNFTIPGTGSSGHISGAVILAALLGPEAAFISMISILAVQCLLFGDGGLLALGCNIINMSFFGCFVGYKLIFKQIIKKGFSKKRMMIGSILASIISLQLGAFFVVLETLASGITSLPFGTFILFMQPIHLVIGLVEGVATGLICNFVYENKPEIFKESKEKTSGNISKKKLVTIFLIASLFIGGGVSLLASGNPDGLEWSILNVAGSTELDNTNKAQDISTEIQEKISIFPDYEMNSEDDSDYVKKFKSAVVGIVGTLITLGVAIGGANILSKNRKMKIDNV